MTPGEFLRWWGAELRAIASFGADDDAGLRDRSGLGGGSGDVLELVIEGEGLLVHRRRGRQRETRHLIPGEEAAPGPATGAPWGEERGAEGAGAPGRLSVASLPGPAPGPETDIVLRVPRELGLSHVLELPAPAAENLHEVLGFEMERLTPFRTGDVFYDARLEGEAGPGRVRVRLTVVPRRSVAWVLALLPPSRVSAALAQDEGLPRLRVLETEEGFALHLPARRRARLGAPRLLTIGAALVLVWAAGLAGTALYRQQRELRELEAELARVREAAGQVQALESSLARLGARANALWALREEQPPAAAVIEVLARVLPEGTWLTRLELRGRQLRISGTSESASSLIARLERAPLLQKVQFVSPVTREPATGRERFHLSAELVSEPIGDGAS